MSTVTDESTAVQEPPTKKEVSQALCKLVDGVGFTRDDSLEALSTMAEWTKQDYAVESFKLMKTYACVPLLLDYLEDHIGKEDEEEEENKKKKQPVKKAEKPAATEGDAAAEVTEDETEEEEKKYDEACVKAVAHVLSQYTYGGAKTDPNVAARKIVAEQMVATLVEHKAVLKMLEAIEAGLALLEESPDALSVTEHSKESAATENSAAKSKLPKSIQSLWSAMWNIMNKQASKEMIPEDRKLKLFKVSVSCMELLGKKDQKIAGNILKILRHILPPDSEFSAEGIQAIKDSFAMNKIVDAVTAKSEYWIEPDATPEVPNEGFCKSLIQFLYRYVKLPGMTEDIPNSVWESRVVSTTARCMKEYPKQKEIHWCGSRILAMAFDEVGIPRENMEKLGALSAIAVTVENYKSDDEDATKKKALELMTKLTPTA